MNYTNFKKLYFTGAAEKIADANIYNKDYPKDTSVMKTSSTDIKKEIERLMRCDLLITCDDWENNPMSVQLVTVARIAKIEIIHNIRYQYNVINK